MKGHITDKKKKSEKKGAVKRIFLGALLIGIGALILGGCGSSTEETQSEQEKTASAKKEDDKIQIGFFCHRKMDPRQRRFCGDCQRNGCGRKCAGCRGRC